MTDDEEVFFARAWYKAEFDCPACGEVNQVDHDPAGEELECAFCVSKVIITEVM